MATLVNSSQYLGEIIQGCPISAILFILVVEVMVVNIRSDENIRSIDINGFNIKITQYACDTILYLKDPKSLKNTFNLLDHFQQCSGLKLNK